MSEYKRVKSQNKFSPRKGEWMKGWVGLSDLHSVSGLHRHPICDTERLIDLSDKSKKISNIFELCEFSSKHY